MKQKITKYYNGTIRYKYYENDKGELHGLFIDYWEYNNKLYSKTNFVNGKYYGLDTSWYKNGKINEQIYYL